MNFFKNLAVFTVTLIIFLASCSSGGRVTGSGPLITDNRRLLPFDKIVLSAGVELIIKEGDEQAVNVNAQQQVQPVLLTEVKGDKLTIKTMGNVSMDGATSVEVIIPELSEIVVTSSGDVSVRDLDGEKLEIAISGSGNAILTEINYDKIDLSVSGSGDVEASGRGEKFDVAVSGSGSVNAFQLASKEAKVVNKGSGDSRISVKDKLDAEIKGSGSIYYRGDPKVTLKDSGSGELKAE